MRDSVTVMLPVPHRNTGGNARGHGLAIYRVRNVAKQTAGTLVRDTMNRAGLYGDVRWERVRIELTWLYRNANHRPDPDNVESRCKPYIDALVAVGLIVDDGPEHVTAIDVNYERAGLAGVQMTIHRLEDGS